MRRHRAGGRPNWQGQVGQILDGDGGYIPGQATARDHLVRHVSKGIYGGHVLRSESTATRGHLMRNAQADDLGVPVTIVARGGGLELSPGPCYSVMASPDLSREHGVHGEIHGRSCRPVPGGYGVFVITV
jgi:hypothetical protein